MPPAIPKRAERKVSGITADGIENNINILAAVRSFDLIAPICRAGFHRSIGAAFQRRSAFFGA